MLERFRRESWPPPDRSPKRSEGFPVRSPVAGGKEGNSLAGAAGFSSGIGYDSL